MSSGNGAMRNAVNAGFEVMMGPDADDKVRKVAIAAAVIGFASHLLLWALHNSGQLTIEGDSMELVKSPLSALYTPFSILLAYEVYQLIRTIPESFSSSVGKQYEIATLLVVRDILKRLSDVNSSEGLGNKQRRRLPAGRVRCLPSVVLHLPRLSQHKEGRR